MKPSNNPENKTSSDTYWRAHPECKKVPAHSSLQPPLEYSQDQICLWQIKFIMIFPTILGVKEILCSFRLVVEGKTGSQVG